MRPTKIQSLINRNREDYTIYRRWLAWAGLCEIERVPAHRSLVPTIDEE
jgi:hypothetical protein